MLKDNPGKSVIIVVGSGDYTGAARMAHIYGGALRAHGWKTLFVTGDRPTDGSRCIADELDRDGFGVTEMRGFTKMWSGALVRELAEYIRRHRPTFVLSTVQIDVKIVGPACRRAAIPYIVFDQNLHRFYGPKPLQWLKRAAFRKELLGAKGLIAVSGGVRKQVVSDFGFEAERAFVVPNGIDSHAFVNNAEIASTVPKRSTGIRLLNVGRLDPQKGQHFLIDAVRKALSSGIECDLLLVGGAMESSLESVRYAEQLRKQVSDLGLSEWIHFLGWRSDIAALHRAADAYIHSATWEGFPLAPLEAMASGRPVIQTDCVGWPEGFVQHTHGMVVNSSDSDALFEGIKWMARLRATERQEIGRHAQQLIQSRYDRSQTGSQFVELCSRLLALPN
ncbi:MAG TPA: glycosyltransferase family 4 protein [Chthoniobacterales bacterium]